jgi:hypothetical protein
MSQQELDSYAVQWARDESSAADIKARMAARARSKYANNPDIISLLDRGFSLSDAFAGHTSQIARLLEVSPESINLADPEWQSVLQHPQGGAMSSMTISQAANLARSSEKYVGTDNARKAAVNALTGLRKAFGF